MTPQERVAAISGAIRANRPVITVGVHVKATQVMHAKEWRCRVVEGAATVGVED
jgi:hypothetical protein